LAVKRKGNAAMKLLETLKKEIKHKAHIAKNMNTDDFNQNTDNSRVEALNNDVQGRFAKAFRGEARFNRWGKHYLYALLRAHQLNICTNFMDPGLQVNGGNLFRELRAKGDEVFVNLPPPKPSRATARSRPVYQAQNQRRQNQPQRQRPAYQPPAPAVNMNNYYGGAGGGCFAPFCTVVVMENGRKCIKKISEVLPGDMVEVADKKGTGFATVVFKVELSRNSRRRMIRFPSTGLVLTGGHPIRRNGSWCLPREQCDAQSAEGCGSVFAFVLDQSHVMIVNGMECISWGHGLIDDEIVSHPFFGTDEIIKTLKQKVMGAVDVMDVDPLHNVIAIHQ